MILGLAEVLAGDGTAAGGGRSAGVGMMALGRGRGSLMSPGVLAGGDILGAPPLESSAGAGGASSVPGDSPPWGLLHPRSSLPPVASASPLRLGGGTDTSHCTSGPPRGGSAAPMSPVIAISPMLRITTSFATLSRDLTFDLTSAPFTSAQDKDPPEAPLTAPFTALFAAAFTAQRHTSGEGVFHQRGEKVSGISAPLFTLLSASPLLSPFSPLGTCVYLAWRTC